MYSSRTPFTEAKGFTTTIGKSHERHFHGAWLTPRGFCQRGMRARRERQLVCSRRWIYLPDKLEWRCEIPAGGHISSVCLCFWVEGKDGEIYNNRGEDGKGCIIDPDDGLK